MIAADWIDLAIGIVLLVTLLGVLWYACETRKMRLEMIRQKREEVRPILDIRRPDSEERTGEDLVREGSAALYGDMTVGLQCVLCNIGLGPATDVKAPIRLPTTEEEREWDFGTMAKGAEEACTLSIQSEGNQMFLVARYRDLYGRTFESSREVHASQEPPSWDLGPLKTRSTSHGQD